MSPAISASHHSGDHHSAQHTFPLQQIAPAPQSEAPGPSNTPTSQSQQGITSAVTTATAAQAAAAAVAAGRDMKNFSDMEINELLGLIPDEYNAEQEQEAAEAAATAAAKAASALGKGVHHTVTVAAPSLPSNIHRIPSNVTMGKHQTGGSNIDAASYMGAKTQEAHIAAQEAELRSERKRSREKQRRNDVNKQFAELTEVLKNIEREAQEMGRKDDAYGSISTMMAIAATTGPTNRVDLIARTIVHLERLNRTAKKQREEISNLQEQLERTKKAGEDLAEKLKDIMFTQQKQFTTSTFAPYQNTTASLATPTDGASTVSAPNPTHAPTTNSAPQHNPTQQQMPMMMMPVMMPPSTAHAPGSSSANPGTHQQQFMMVMPHPGSQMPMPSQPLQQMMQPVIAMQQQQQQQPIPQQVQQTVQQLVTQQQTYVPQQHLLQQQQQQQQQIAPATQDRKGHGNASTGENLAHAA